MKRLALLGILLGLATGGFFFVQAINTPHSSCACVYPPRDRLYEIYLVDLSGEGTVLRSERVKLPESGNPGLVAVQELLSHIPAGSRQGNAWTALNEPIAEANSVSHTNGVVTVDLDRDVWDPYPLIDLDMPYALRIATQQLVWTVQQAIGTDDPVLVTVGGDPARGIWLQRLDGPVEADLSLVQQSS